METVYQYIFTLISAAIVCTVILTFTDKKSPLHPVMKFLIGVFLTITLISPFKEQRMIDISDFLSGFENNSEAYVQSGKEYSYQEKEAFIKENISAYILDRAKALDVDIAVNVDLKQDLSGPEVIYISGNVSPYKKEQLQSIIENDLGTTKENQVWR